MSSAPAVVGEILRLYASHGGRRYGEDVTQTEHALQCAALAVRAGAPDPLIAAALLHDIGHLLDEISERHGNFRHDRVGGDWLARRFGPAVAEPVRLHAAAKRYLCYAEADYYAALSQASQYSLVRQGGVMSGAEAGAFRQLPYAGDALQLRRWDDHGKIEGLEAGRVGDYADLLRGLLRNGGVQMPR